MTRVRILMVLVIALLTGGGLAAGTYSYLRNVPVKTVSVPTTKVVVARADLALGSELDQDDLAVIEWPQAAVPEGVISDPSEVVGRGLIASVVKNEPILATKLASKEAGSGLPPIIPKGKRAVSVQVDEVISVAGYVLPGTIVDVLATQSPTSRPEDMTSKVVLTQVPVLTAGTRLEHDQKEGKPVQVTVVTLLVTPDEAERLALAASEGKINLALRNPLDQEAPPTRGIRPGALMGSATPAPAPRARAPKPRAPQPAPVAAPPTIEIIRGDKRETAKVG
jgi:pilus assembly protein CpaB